MTGKNAHKEKQFVAFLKPEVYEDELEKRRERKALQKDHEKQKS